MTYRLTRSMLFVLALTISVSMTSNSTVQAQGDGIFGRLFVNGEGPGGTLPDFGIHTIAPFGGDPGAFEIFPTSDNFPRFTIFEDAPIGAAQIGKDGVGIGFSNAIGGLAEQPLHVVGGGSQDAYPEANILVEDRGNQFLDMLTLQNSGGNRLNMNDEAAAGETEFSRFAIQNFDNRIEFRHSEENNFSIPLRFAAGNKTNVLVHPNGLGVGTFSSNTSSPNSALHVFSDGSRGDSATITSQVAGSSATRSRTMLNLVNNGAPSMTFTDSSNNSTWFFSNTNDELNLRKGGAGLNPGFIIGSDGKFRFVRDAVAEAPRLVIDNDGNLCIPGQVICVSDRNKKENIKSVDALAVLEKVATMPISTWNYIEDKKKVSHIGPMAQDFNAAFELGNDTTIGQMDKSGVTMAAVQGLNQKVDAKSKIVVALKAEVTSQKSLIEQQLELIEQLQDRMEQLESMVSSQQN